MRVCLFTPTFLPKLGGAEIAADRILRGLQTRGHDVHALVQRPRDGEPDVPYPVSTYRRPPKQHLWPELLSRPITRLHRRWPFDVMLAFFGYPNGFAAARVKDRLGFRLAVCARGADLYPDFHSLRKPRVPRTIIEGYRGADRIVTVSRYLADRIATINEDVAGTRPLPPVDVIHNGMDLEAFGAEIDSFRDAAPPAWARAAGIRSGRYLLTISRLTDVKEHRRVIEAIAANAGKFREGGWQYVIAGDGTLAPALRQCIDQSGLDADVLMVGSRFDDDKSWLLAHAWGIVSASRDEGLPGALIEALAAGLPVLASDIAPHEEVMHADGAGRFFRCGDTAHLGEQLIGILGDDRAAMTERARIMSRRFASAAMIDAYDQLCRTLVESRPAAGVLAG